jgi:hypothetical protein
MGIEKLEIQSGRLEAALLWLWDGYRSHNAFGVDGPCECAQCENVRQMKAAAEESR